MSNLTSVVEDIQELSVEEKEEVFFLLNQYLIESRRDEIYSNYQKSKDRKKHRFTNNVKELKERLNV